MTESPGSWQEIAMQVYRAAWTELQEHWCGAQPEMIVYLIDDLKDALLDLKQATIAGDAGRAMQHMAEVRELLVELKAPPSGDAI